jgi:hypothetical protein
MVSTHLIKEEKYTPLFCLFVCCLVCDSCSDLNFPKISQKREQASTCARSRGGFVFHQHLASPLSTLHSPLSPKGNNDRMEGVNADTFEQSKSSHLSFLQTRDF